MVGEPVPHHPGAKLLARVPRSFPIIQFPNAPLLAATAAAAVARLTTGTARRRAGLLSRLALLVWAYGELVSGANWFRRLLGAGVGANNLAALARLARRRGDERS